MAPVREVQVTFDCVSPRAVGRFWCEALGYEPTAPPDGSSGEGDADASRPADVHDGWFAASDPTGAGPRLYFQRVPEGKVVKNRVHLDVRVATGLTGERRVAALQAEADRLVALGASRLRLLEADDENEACLVMQDVEGNEFCLD